VVIGVSGDSEARGKSPMYNIFWRLLTFSLDTKPQGRMLNDRAPCIQSEAYLARMAVHPVGQILAL
jgi:hypothetical protein